MIFSTNSLACLGSILDEPKSPARFPRRKSGSLMNKEMEMGHFNSLIGLQAKMAFADAQDSKSLSSIAKRARRDMRRSRYHHKVISIDV